MTHQRNDENFRGQNVGPQNSDSPYGGRQQAGGQFGGQSSGQHGGYQDQHSQYSGASGGQYGSPSSGRQYGGNDYQHPSPSTGGQGFQGRQPQDFGQPGYERQWGPSASQNTYQGNFTRDQGPFSGHYGAEEPGWTPSRQGGAYGGRGFGATGHGSQGYSGQGTFHNEPSQSDFNQHFSQQGFDQFGRERFGQEQFGQEHSGRQQFGQRDQQRSQRDPHYQQWREEQLRRFDEDYDQWHQERYQSFANDFNDWRSRRQTTQGGQSNQGNRNIGEAAAGSEAGGDLSSAAEPRMGTKSGEASQAGSKGNNK